MTVGPAGRLRSGIFIGSGDEREQRGRQEPGRAGIAPLAMFCTAKVRTRSAVAAAGERVNNILFLD